MRNSVGFVVIGGGTGKRERSGGGGGGGGKGKRGAELMGVGDGGVGTLGIERVAESWWDNVRVSSSSCVDRRVVSGSRASSSSVSEWEGSEGESVGEGSRGLGRNQRGLRVGCCEMVGDYYGDSSVKENLNLLLHLTRVEANVDLKDKGEGFLKGIFKSKGCWGLPQQLLATTGCLGSSRTKVYKQAHTRE